VDSEFDDYRPLRNVKHLGTDIDDAPTEVEALIEGTTAAKLSDLVEFRTISRVYHIY